MPKEMLLEKAATLREIAEALESYAGEDSQEESSEGESSSPMSAGMPPSAPAKSDGGSKIKMALAAMKKGK